MHCSASAVPTALALASETDVSGTSFLLAVLIATEIDARLGSAAGGTFQQLGFHPTGLVGIFGATVAAVRLLGGTVQDMVRAQGIALSMTGGSMAFLEAGTWTKRLHPGWAAQSALAAAKLAMAGFDAPQEAYSGRHGFYALYTRAAENADKVEWDDAFREFAIASVAIKPYPICHFNHAPVDAALTLASNHGIGHHDIEEVSVALHERQLAVVAEPPHGSAGRAASTMQNLARPTLWLRLWSGGGWGCGNWKRAAALTLRFWRWPTALAVPMTPAPSTLNYSPAASPLP